MLNEVAPCCAPESLTSSPAKLAGEALLDYVIGTEEPAVTTHYDINIYGEYNLVGELWQVVQPAITGA